MWRPPQRIRYTAAAGRVPSAAEAAASVLFSPIDIGPVRLEQRTWETENGDKRSIVEINADEIGPSLKWATAVVTRTPRAEGSNFQSNDRPAAPARPSEPTYAFDEEPF